MAFADVHSVPDLAYRQIQTIGKRREITTKAALKEMIQLFLKNSEVSSMEDMMELLKEAVAEFLNIPYIF